ncbi:mitochondrial ribosomal protein S7 [Arctopsyche grandis]|uniref:mitochondrial ribosomal protein S7 n=1 Tax=Arctopsyche grandis TaxID=121162 RepID=UPI00406D7989
MWARSGAVANAALLQALRLPSHTINSIRESILCNAKKMSVYAPYYIEPIIKKEDLNKIIENDEISKYMGVPVKAPLVDQTSSSFNNELVRKFINHIMEAGNKTLARTLMEKTFENIKRKQIERYHLATDQEKKNEIELNPVKIFHTAIFNCRPMLELMPVRRGGATYQVPVPVRDNRARFLAIKWMIAAAKEKDSKMRFHEKLAWELIDAASNQGKVIKRKQDLHRQCESNRAYAHYRWS